MTLKTSNLFYSISEKIKESNNKEIFKKIVINHYGESVKDSESDKTFILLFAIGRNLYFCINKKNIAQVYYLKDLEKMNIQETDVNLIIQKNIIRIINKNVLLENISKLFGINVLLVTDKQIDRLNTINTNGKKNFHISKIICKTPDCDLNKYTKFKKIFIYQNEINRIIFEEDGTIKIYYKQETELPKLLDDVFNKKLIKEFKAY